MNVSHPSYTGCFICGDKSHAYQDCPRRGKGKGHGKPGKVFMVTDADNINTLPQKHDWTVPPALPKCWLWWKAPISRAMASWTPAPPNRWPSLRAWTTLFESGRTRVAGSVVCNLYRDLRRIFALVTVARSSPRALFCYHRSLVALPYHWDCSPSTREESRF